MGHITVNSITDDASGLALAEGAVRVGDDLIRLMVFQDFIALRPAWRAFELQCDLSPYQSVDWFDAFWRSGSAGPDVELQIVAGFDAQSNLIFAAPLAIETGVCGRTAAILGDRNSAHRAPAICPKLLEKLDPQSCRTLIDTIGQLARLDALCLEQQPATLNSVSTPWCDLGALHHGEAISDAIFDKSWSAYDAAHRSSKTRSKEKNRLNALGRLGEVSFKVYKTATERHAALTVLLSQKTAALEACGVDVFAKETTRNFLSNLVTIERDNGAFSHVCALTVDDEIVAASLGVVQGTNFSGLILSIGDPAYARYSPGQLLISHLLEHAATTGITRFSFGLGESDLKSRWTDDTTELFSTAFPFTLRGGITTALAKIRWWARDAAKHSYIAYYGLCYARTAAFRISRWWKTPWYAAL